MTLARLLYRLLARALRPVRRLRVLDPDRLRPLEEISMPMTPEQERQLYRDYRRTAAMRPGGLIVSRRA